MNASDRLVELINQSANVLQGYCPGGGNTGQQVSVRVSGRSPIQATCGGIVPPGNCALLSTPRGWFVLSSVAPQMLLDRQVQSRQNRISNRIQVGAIKTLSRINGQVGFYIGGDRRIPTLAHQYNPAVFAANARFSNLGRNLNDWSFQSLENASIGIPFTRKFRTKSPTETYVYASYTQAPTYVESNEVDLADYGVKIESGVTISNIRFNVRLERGFLLRLESFVDLKGSLGQPTEGTAFLASLFKNQITFTQVDRLEQILSPASHLTLFFPPNISELDAYGTSALGQIIVSRFYTDDGLFNLAIGSVINGVQNFSLIDSSLVVRVFSLATDTSILDGISINDISFFGSELYVVSDRGIPSGGIATATVKVYSFNFETLVVSLTKIVRAQYYVYTNHRIDQVLYHPG